MKNQDQNELVIFFFFFKLSKTINILSGFFVFFLLMVNLGSMDDSRYTGFREILDHDVLDLQCITECVQKTIFTQNI